MNAAEPTIANQPDPSQARGHGRPVRRPHNDAQALRLDQASGQIPARLNPLNAPVHWQAEELGDVVL
jgi:hypothetical protein